MGYSGRVLSDIISFKTWAQQHSIHFIAVHGSAVTGRLNPQSDVDVAVLAGQALSLSEQVDLEAPVKNLLVHFLKDQDLSGRSLDITDCFGADPLFKFEVATKGQALYEDFPGAFNNFKVQSAREYADTEIFRRQRWAFMQKEYGS